MQNYAMPFVRSLAVALAAAAVTASLAAPARASNGPGNPALQPGTVNPGMVTTQWWLNMPADLILEKLAVNELPGDKYQLTATLRNGLTSVKVGNTTQVPQGHDYPGGGTLRITRTSGGTLISANPDPFLAVPDLGTVLASQSIPALKYGKAIQLSAITKGKAIFWAGAVPPLPDPDSHQTPTLPEANPNNDSKTVNMLISHQFSINTAILQTFLGSFLNSIQLRLDHNDSFVTIPGVIDKHWGIGEVYSQAIPVFPFLGAVGHWYVNDINLQGIDPAVEGGGLSFTFNFETSGDEVVGIVSDGPDWLAPNVNGNPLQITIKLPLSYDASLQYFHYHDPQVIVNAHWTLNGPLPDSLLPNVNGQIHDQIMSALTSGKIQQQLEFQLNKAIRTQLLKGGRIISASIHPDAIDMEIETPW